MDDDSKHDEAASPLHTTSTDHSENLGDPIPGNGTPKSDSQSANTFADNDKPNVIPYPSIHSTQSPVNFALDNFFFAMSLISLIVFTTFSAMTWFTVLQDTRSMTDRVLLNATGVSLCLYQNERALPTIIVAIGIDTRSHLPTGPGRMRVIHFMEGRRLRCGHV